MTAGPHPHPALPADLADRIDPQQVLHREVAYHGHVWDIAREDFDLDGEQLRRDVLVHPGAVAVVALRGALGAEQVLLIQQYRHPVGAFDWELPAGLLDHPGEPPQHAAARELLEETDLAATHWQVLTDVFTSPGAMSENVRIFLAREVHPQAHDFERTGEERGMPTGWLDLDQALAAIQQSRIHNALAIVGIQSAVLARQASWAPLRPADAPWPQHPAYR